jgi:hypothetical protein
MICDWKLVARDNWAVLAAPQVKNGAVVSIGEQASGATTGDSAVPVCSVPDDPEGALEAQAPVKIAAAATRLNHFFEPMMRSS